jgi:hypothetical protein
VRGLGILRLPFVTRSRLALVVELALGDRLPEPHLHETLALPVMRVDPASASAPQRVALALECAQGRVAQLAGAFAA